MQPRKHDDFVTASPSSRIRNQHRCEVGGGHDSYPVSRRGDAVDRSPHLQQHRSLSPHHGNIDGSRRILIREGRSGSTERRDYSWHLGAGRTDKVRSGSPSFIMEHRKPQFEEEVAHRKHKFADDIKYDDGKHIRLKHVYGYDHHGTSSRSSKEKDYNENRILSIDDHMMMGQKSVPVEDDILRGSDQVPSDFDPTSNYRKTGYHLQLPSRRLDTSQFECEKLRYPGPISLEKLPIMQFYNEGENPMFSSRDSSYTLKPTSHSKGLGSTHFKDFAGISSGVPRSEFLSSFREGKPLSSFDEHLRNNMRLTEPMDINTYGQRPSLDMRNLETGKRIMTSYPSGTCSPNRSEHDDFLYNNRSERLVNDDSIYPSVDLHKALPSGSRLNHDQAQTDYEYGELSRMNIMHQVVDTVKPMVDSYRNMRNSTTWDHATHKQAATDNLDANNVFNAPKYSGEYMGSGYSRLQFGRKDLRDNVLAHLDTIPHQKILHLKSDFGFGRDAGPQFQKERLQDPIMSIYDLEMHKSSGKRPKMEEIPIHDQYDKVLKRKYSVEEHINLHGLRTIAVSNQQHTQQEYEAACGIGEGWDYEDGNMLHPSRNRRFDQTAFRKAKRTYDLQDRGDFALEEWQSSQDSLAHSRKHSVRHHKSSVKHTQGHPRTGSVAWYNSHQTDKRIVHRKHKTCIRNDEDDYANDDIPSEDCLNMADSDLPEDSDKFKQLVHEAFLEYSKKLNLNPAVRRRYKEQGKAGSLFCIVCRRSASKEFLDTQRLVTHAFMSHKVGLRALHLGLHKAICVLMGWNTYVPCDTTTWVPDVLPDAEAWAQKKDLMLWPPLVIIHNISMSINNPEKQKVIPIEGVEAFLRGKGFVGGKIKVCLGKPADQSVMLVKFLGTFTGLGIAQRLGKYFSENKRGREEFKQRASNSSNGLEEDNHRNELEEQLLYGYIGIAEDLDELDFNTKKWITVKSKKDIEDLENAPVKTDDR